MESLVRNDAGIDRDAGMSLLELVMQVVPTTGSGLLVEGVGTARQDADAFENLILSAALRLAGDVTTASSLTTAVLSEIQFESTGLLTNKVRGHRVFYSDNILLALAMLPDDLGASVEHFKLTTESIGCDFDGMPKNGLGDGRVYPFNSLVAALFCLVAGDPVQAARLVSHVETRFPRDAATGLLLSGGGRKNSETTRAYTLDNALLAAYLAATGNRVSADALVTSIDRHIGVTKPTGLYRKGTYSSHKQAFVYVSAAMALALLSDDSLPRRLRT